MQGLKHAFIRTPKFNLDLVERKTVSQQIHACQHQLDYRCGRFAGCLFFVWIGGSAPGQKLCYCTLLFDGHYWILAVVFIMTMQERRKKQGKPSYE
jgi:hypothetical protein